MAAPRVTIDQLPEDLVVSGTDWLVIQEGAVTKKMSLATLNAVAQTQLDAHLADTSAVHAASAISAAANDPMDGIDVQTQLNQVATILVDLVARVTALETAP
jgi:hypothetical protein